MATADPALPAADLLPVGPKANIAYRIVRLFAVPIMRLAFRIEVHGAENIPKKGGPNYIVIANHLNWPDEFLLLLLFPIEPRLHFLADPTLLVTRKFQWFVVRHSGGYVPVDAMITRRWIYQKVFNRMDRCWVHSSRLTTAMARPAGPPPPPTRGCPSSPRARSRATATSGRSRAAASSRCG